MFKMIILRSHFQIFKNIYKTVELFRNIKMALEYITNNKGKNFLLVDNFTFYREKIYKGKYFWRCTEYLTGKCLSRCHTKDNVITKRATDHNHVANIAKLEARKVINNIKERATTSREATHQIVSTASENIGPAVSGQLPSIVNMKQIVRRVRHEHQAPLANPTSLEELEIPEPYNKTVTGDNFLLHDSGPGSQRFLIFSTARNLQLLAESPHWYADGTFKSAPPLFQQLYTIHILKFKTIIPVVFVLMNDKSTNTYVRVLTELKNLKSNLNPVTVMTDFEQASLLAFRRIFPDTNQQGCLFHLSQCIWRRMQQIPGLQEHYTSDADFSLGIRHLAALAFVPTVDVIKVFEEILESQFYIDNAEEVRDLINYFEDTWIGRPARRGGRSAPIFPVALWNVHDQVVEDLPRTNNSVEGWHRGFSQLLGAYHPTIWKFIDGLKKEQSLNELKLEQFNAGQQPPPRKKKYRDVAERIKTLVSEYGKRSNVDYIRGIAHNLSLQV